MIEGEEMVGEEEEEDWKGGGDLVRLRLHRLFRSGRRLRGRGRVRGVHDS